MRRTYILLALAAATSLAACGPTVEQRCAGSKDPTMCAAVVHGGGDVKDYLVAGVAGAALARAVSGPSGPQHVVIDNRSRGYGRPMVHTTTVTTTRRSLFGNRTVTRSTTRTSARSRR